MQPNKHRTWAEIDLGAIEHNYRVICEAAKAPVLCVVKADCYGHGAVPVANRLQSMGAPYFAVATVPEAVELRENGIEKPIIILGYIDAADMDTVAEYGITAPVYDEETAELLSAAAVRTGRDITVHYKLDTGMTRIGFPSWEREETVRRILECAKKPGLRSEGIFTHFAVADVPSGEEYTEMQYDRFRGVCEGLAENGLDLPLRHCANSGAIQSYKQMHCTMTRAGIILYGYRPDASVPPVLATFRRTRPSATAARLRRASRRIWRSFRSATQTAFCARARERRTLFWTAGSRPSWAASAWICAWCASRRARGCTAATRSQCSARARGRRRMPPRPPVRSRMRCCVRSAAACRGTASVKIA